MGSEDQRRQRCCFQEWMSLQEEDLSELQQAQNPDPETGHHNASLLTHLAQKGIQHFQDYINKRQGLARVDPSGFFAPSWCTALENSLLWAAGCRPSMFIRLIYALCGSDLEANLEDFLSGVRTGNLSELTPTQLRMVNDLQGKTIKEEDKLTSRLASVQEDIADQPIALIVKKAGRVREMNGDVEKALDDHEKSMVGIMEEADQLRIKTVKEIFSILTPIQAVDFLAASKKLHLCIHEWGKNRDHKHGRKSEPENIAEDI